jgi:drug/metabolite transporter (DMT)-like permease
MLAALAASSWIACTIAASAAQTARNATQRDLIKALGPAGATHVRFLFSLPFIAALFALQTLALGLDAPDMTWKTVAWIAAGGGSQALATGLMLAAMRERSFVVITAYTKVEPVVIALLGAAFLGETLSPAAMAAVFVATSGVLLISWPAKGAAQDGALLGWKPAVLGLSGGVLFALSATSYRGALLDMGDGSAMMKATSALVVGQSLQCALILAWLAAFDRPTISAIAHDWRRSLFAGFMGALASQLWLMAFSLANAAAVRTLALIEVPMALIVTRRVFKQGASLREYFGMALILGGIILLLNV